MLRQRGLSLIELMVAMVIGLVLMLGVTQVFLSTRNVYSNQDAVSRIQETGRLAIEFMGRDARMAGYTGCASGTAGSVTNTIAAPTVLETVEVGVEGIDGATTAPAGYGLTDRVANTDVLIVRAAMGAGVPLTASNGTTSIPISATVETGACADSSNRISGICAGDIAVVADCSKSSIFSVSSITTGGVITPQAALTADDFGTDAEVAVAHTISYYIRVNPANRRALYQRIDDSAPVELLEGVQDMQILYGRDTGTDGIPDEYQTATAVAAAAAWPDVQSVRIQLLVQSTEDNVSPESQPYTFNGVDFVPTDKRLRQVFVSTVGIRSRLLN